MRERDWMRPRLQHHAGLHVVTTLRSGSSADSSFDHHALHLKLNSHCHLCFKAVGSEGSGLAPLLTFMPVLSSTLSMSQPSASSSFFLKMEAVISTRNDSSSDC